MKLRRIFSFAIALIVCMPLLLLPSRGDEVDLRGNMYLYNYGTPISLNHDVFFYFDSGYYEPHQRTNYAALSIYEALATEEVLIIKPHSSEAACIQAPIGSSTSYLCADVNNYRYRVSPELCTVIGNTNATSPKKNFLTVYFGPYTGTTPDPIVSSSSITGYIYPANLITATYAMKSECAVGWTSNVSFLVFDEWSSKFALGACATSVRRTIKEALDFAYWNFESDHHADSLVETLDDYIIRGNKDLILLEKPFIY